MSQPYLDLLAPRVPERGPAQLILVGGPGSGRTWALRGIATTLREQGRRVTLLCPSQDDAGNDIGVARALGLEGEDWPDRLSLADALFHVWTPSDATDVICIDDVDLFDAATLRAICVAVRRLELVVLFTAQGAHQLRSGLPEGEFLQLPGCEVKDIQTLIRDVALRGPVPEVLERLTFMAEGNPGAAKALTMSLTGPQLLGFEPLFPVGFPVPLEICFTSRVPPALYSAALLLACAVVSELGTLMRAGEALRIPASDFDELEKLGLAVKRPRGLALRPAGLGFALEALSTAGERQRSYSALADANRPVDAPRALWHRAQAVDAADADLADHLEAMTDGPGRIIGLVSASQILQRASELSTTAEEQGRRLAAAAEYAWLEGTPALSLRLLSEAEGVSTDIGLSLRVAYVRGSIELAAGDEAVALRVMLDAVPSALQRLPADESTALLMRASDAAVASGNIHAAVELSKYAGTVKAESTDPAVSARLTLVAGTGKVLAGQFDAGMSLVDEALLLCVQQLDQPEVLVGMRAALIAGDATSLLNYADLSVDRLTRNSNRGLLPFATARRALAEVLLGRFRSAIDITIAGVQESTLLGQENARAEHLAVQALALARAGDESQVAQVAGQALKLACDCGLAWPGAVAVWALGEVELGSGRAEQALDRLSLLWHGNPYERHPLVATLAAAETVEAAVRAGRADEGDVALRRLVGWAEATGNSAVFGLVERCMALRSDDPSSITESFEKALLLHRRAARAFDEARTALAYGAWLRRERRRSECRLPLRRAHETFESIGAASWQANAAREMRASGISVRHREAAEGTRHLTAQELTIAKMVADGDSNRDVASRLYLSVRTVEYHLRNVFAKLGLRSRTELAALHGALDEMEATGGKRG